jgi:ubiquinone/menaquinone biosynthesis C-methylase UbiE
MLKFDAETTRLLDLAYQGADVIKRRRLSFDAVDPKPAETILDIGSGNGLLTAELARAVGPAGRVTGVDPSEDMRKAAIPRCAEFGWVDFRDGSVYDLPVESGSVDKAVSVQVFEYLDDIPLACREAARVLRNGGRLVVSDIHFDSLIWHTADQPRMDRMIAAWDAHFVERRVPALLPQILREAGFEIAEIRPVTITDHDLKPDGLARTMLTLMESYAKQSALVPDNECAAWREEQETLAAQGRFFFSITQFAVIARKA